MPFSSFHQLQTFSWVTAKLIITWLLLSDLVTYRMLTRIGRLAKTKASNKRKQLFFHAA